MSGLATAATECIRHRVLIVDDQRDMRELLRMRLGFADDMDVIGEASNGLEAIAMCRTLRPDAAVLDLEMPVVRGDQAIPMMRAAAHGIRILMYSGSSRATLDALTGGDAGPDHFLKKECSLNELVTQLRAVLNADRVYRGSQGVLEWRHREIVRAIAAIVTASASR